MTYNLGMSEKAKQRVDMFGHVNLTDREAEDMSRTRAINIITVVAGLGTYRGHTHSHTRMSVDR